MKGSWSEISLCFMQGPRGRSGLKGDRGDTGEPVSGPRKSGKKTGADPEEGKMWIKRVGQQMARTGSRSKTKFFSKFKTIQDFKIQNNFFPEIISQ